MKINPESEVFCYNNSMLEIFTAVIVLLGLVIQLIKLAITL